MNIFTPNHVQLLNACYPPSSALLTAGPDYAPKSQELSRLTYFASNNPTKITKFGSELEKRVKADCRKTRSGNARGRASLLITLAILRSIAVECRRDIALLSPSLISCVDATLKVALSDLEVVARVASVITAWTTYTDGHLIGADSSMTKDYLSILTNFGNLAASDHKDTENKHRNRLVGLSAITGALNSEALYNDSSQFKAQVSIILQPLLKNIFQTPMAILNDQATNIRKAPSSQFLAEFRSRPTVERRAASIHAHVDGDTGPSSSDVSKAALHALYSLLQHANGSQLGYIMRSSFENIDQLKSWRKVDYCSWFARVVAEWSQYQYRYVVPTWTVEHLVQVADSSTSDMQTTLLAMATHVLNSPVPLINLSTSDLISNLLSILLRKVAANPKDTILSPLVKCIASLGSHVYYSDQIQDLAGELINRLALIELQGVPGANKSDQSRAEALRCIIAALLGLMDSAQRHDQQTKQSKTPITPVRASDSTPADEVKQDATERLLRRTRVLPDIWQDTLSLICDTQFSIRADYSAGLISYLTYEYPKRGDSTDADGVRRARPLADGPIQHAATISAVLHGNDFGIKFLNNINAYLFVLAISADLGLRSPSPTPAPDVSQISVPGIQVNIQPATPNGETPVGNEPGVNTDSNDQQSSHKDSRRSFAHPPRSRKNSGVKRMLERASNSVASTAAASFADYALILDVITALHQQLPIRALLTGIPMLLALDASCRLAQEPSSPSHQFRLDVIRFVIAKAWLVIGNIWDCPGLILLVESTLSNLPDHVRLPVITPVECGTLEPARDPIPFPEASAGESSQPWEGVPANKALLALVENSNVQEATGLNQESLLSRLTAVWTPQSALSNPVERSATLDTIRPEGVTPLLKISPALMHIENISLQSLTRSIRGVGVTDLREALEGRSSMSTSNLVRPPSLSTVEHPGSSVFHDNHLTPTRSRTSRASKKRNPPPGSGEVKDVLNKLGIGKQGTANKLKSSFPTKSPAPRPPV